MKAIYIGAGSDTRPLKRLDFITTFVHVDSQPYSEFGTRQCNIKMAGGYNGYSRPKFVKRLCKNMKSVGMILVSVDKNIIYYKDIDNRSLRYYINTAVPDHNKFVESEINTSDILIMAGHDPHYSILEFVNKKIMFVGFEGTCFSDCGEYEEGSLTQSLHVGNTLEKFSSFTYVSSDAIEKFNTWGEFVARSTRD